MKRFFERFVGWLIAAVFVAGCYAIAHYMLKADDSDILLFALVMIWTDIAGSINKPDAKAS